MFKTLLIMSAAATLMISCSSTRIHQTENFGETLTATDSADKIFVALTYDSIQVKYGVELKVDPESIKNLRLYNFIDKWMKVPYKWGGNDEKGIDCSAFLKRLLFDVYQVQIPRTSIQQFFTDKVEPFASSKYLSEGDLVFFRTINNTYVSHVGLYLRNNLFINASSSKGVSIASLNDPYWKRRYVASGRIRSSISKR